MRVYWVYILASASRRLYTGVTNNLIRRHAEHRMRTNRRSFSARYNITRLVYFEEFGDIRLAITREKQIKGWSREKKLRLIRRMNPEFLDLAESWSSNEDTMLATGGPVP